MGFDVNRLGLRVQGFRFRVWNSGSRVWGLGFWTRGGFGFWRRGGAECGFGGLGFGGGCLVGVGVGQDVLVARVVLERLVRDAAVRGDRGLSTQKWTDSYHTSHSGNL